MKSRKKGLYGLIVIMVFCPTMTWAKTLYISDQLVVSLRELPIEGSEVLTYLVTDVPVELIDETDLYFQVRTAHNKVGFIKKTYLTETLPKSSIIKQQSQENALLRRENDDLMKIKRALIDAGKQEETLKKRIQNIGLENKQFKQSYESLKRNAKNVDQIVNEKDQLKEENKSLSAQVTSLSLKNGEEFYSQSLRWFLAGAGVFFFGWLLGRISRRKHRFVR